MPQVYFFGDGKADGGAEDKALLGGKGANLAEMTRLGLPVPPGFTITTATCNHTFANGGTWPDGLDDAVRESVVRIGKSLGKSFGDSGEPLLLSVRSGAPVSMPGMMDTVLNLGLNDETVEALATASGNPRFAWDSYRRFLYMFGDVVLGIHGTRFERARRAEFQDVEIGDMDVEGLKQATNYVIQKYDSRL